MATEPVALSGLARRLVDEGLIEAEAAIKAADEARKAGLALVSYLVKNTLVDPKVLATSAAQEFGVPLMDLSVFDVDSVPKDLVKEQLIRQHNAMKSSSRPASTPNRYW